MDMQFKRYYIILGLLALTCISAKVTAQVSILISVVYGNNICVPDSVAFLNSDPTPGYKEFIWNFGDGSTYVQNVAEKGDMIKHFFTLPGTYKVQVDGYDNGGNLKGIGGLVITLYGPDKISIKKSADITCDGNAIFVDKSQSFGDGTKSVSWNFGDGSISSIDSVQYTYSLIDTTYYVKLTVTNNCTSSTDSTSIRIFPLDPKIWYPPAQLCQHAEVSFTNSDTKAGIIYSWNFDDGSDTSSTLSVNHVFDNAGTYNVTLTEWASPNAPGCIQSDSTNVIVLQAPLPDFTASPIITCDSAIVKFVNIPDTAFPADTYHWNFGNSDSMDTIDPPDIQYKNFGNYQVKLTAYRSSTNCSVTKIDTITVPSTPVANFSAKNVCVNQLASFSDTSKISFGTITSWAWNFGDGSMDTIQNATHTYTNSGNKNVTLKVSTGACADSITQSLPIDPLPVIDISPLAQSGCPPLQIQFNNNTTGAVKYTWDFGDGITDTLIDPTHVYQNDSAHNVTYNLSLVAQTSFGCKDTVTGSYLVYQAPHSSFNSDINETPVCVPDTVQFISTSTGPDGFGLSWDFGDNIPVSDSITTHIFENEQHYFRYFKVNLVARTDSGCTDTAFQYITLYPKPNTDFVMDTLSSTCDSVKVLLTAPEEYKGAYTWVFEPPGDTVKTIDWHAAYEFSKGSVNQVFQVRLITENQFGCFGDTVKNLTVPPLTSPPVINFIPDPVRGCPDLNVSFQDLSKNTDTTTYIWDFGDGTHSFEVNPTHTFYDGGSKTVQLTAKGLDCSVMLKETIIQVFENPSAAFNVTPDIAWVPDNPVLCSPVYQLDNWRYSWNFGDGETSDSMEVVHYYKDTATFKITLIVVTENNCSDMVSKTIMAKTSGSVESPNVFFPVVGGGGGNGDGSGLVGDGDDVFAPVTQGVVEYHLEVYDRWGERLFKSDSKEIGWTGYYRGILCKEDVYVWKLFGKYTNNVKFIKAGTITLLHK